MNSRLTDYLVEPTDMLLEALQRIDHNTKGFLIVTDYHRMVLGTLTDGDIRRALIKGILVGQPIEGVYHTACKSLKNTQPISVAGELFKNQSIDFIPIVDAYGHLVNIITKKQMHALLLQDIRADLNYDFFQLDEGVVDYEVYHRPWGFYKTTVLNDFYQSKIISVNPGEQLSLQSHNHREEYWIVVHGKGMVQIGESYQNVRCGTTLFIPKTCKHRLANLDKTESLILTEVQIGDYFGEDDIIRYQDDYGRETIQKGGSI